MSRFFGYSHYHLSQEQQRLHSQGVRPPPEGLSLLGRTLLVLGILALVCIVAAIMAMGD